MRNAVAELPSWSPGDVAAALPYLTQEERAELDRLLTPTDTPTSLTPEQVDEWRKCRDEPAYFISTYCQIEIDNGDGSLRWGPFVLWPDQVDLVGHFKRNKRACALKARQCGFSWVADADALHDMTFRPIASVLIFSKTDREAMKMLGRLIGMWSRLPDWLRPAAARRPSAHELELANGSRAMAMPCNAGQSYTGTLAIIDEADKFERVNTLDTLLAAVKPTVDAGGRLLLISTSEKTRPTSLFKKIFRAGDEGGYKCVFYPWSARPTRTQEWYDQLIAETLATTGSLDFVHQEYPATVEEALAANEMNCRLPPSWVEQCFREVPRITYGSPGAIQGTLDAFPDIPGLIVWKMPEPGRRYVLGVDPSEGQPGSHESPIHVLDADTCEEMAVFPGPAPMHVLGNYIVKLAAWYNGASVLIERNNHGHAVLLWLDSHGKGTYVMAGPDGRPGWLEGSAQKMLLYDLAAKKLRESECVIHDPGTKGQLCSIEANTLKAPQGMPDDRAMSFVIALTAADCVPRGKYDIY